MNTPTPEEWQQGVDEAFKKFQEANQAYLDKFEEYKRDRPLVSLASLLMLSNPENVVKTYFTTDEPNQKAVYPSGPDDIRWPFVSVAEAFQRAKGHYTNWLSRQYHYYQDATLEQWEEKLQALPRWVDLIVHEDRLDDLLLWVNGQDEHISVFIVERPEYDTCDPDTFCYQFRMQFSSEAAMLLFKLTFGNDTLCTPIA